MLIAISLDYDVPARAYNGEEQIGESVTVFIGHTAAERFILIYVGF